MNDICKEKYIFAIVIHYQIEPLEEITNNL